MGVDAKQVQNAGCAEDPKGPEPGQEEEGQDGEQVHDPVEGKQKPQHRPGPGIVRIQKIRRPDAEGVLGAEDGHGHVLYPLKEGPKRVQSVEGFQKQDGDVAEDHRHDKIVEDPAGRVLLIADLDDLEDPFFLFCLECTLEVQRIEK